ncbi:hypothetical protein LJB81_04270 [Desulfovibrio sp. OttesenSCG-928-M14]|nr:hypothetical protein [Desulfovibrio sp. OttesenSCG-928-M14]
MSVSSLYSSLGREAQAADAAKIAWDCAFRQLRGQIKWRIRKTTALFNLK